MNGNCCRVVDVESIELNGRDIVVLSRVEDFWWLARNDLAVWRLKGSLYILSESAAFLFYGEDDEVGR